MLAISVRNVSLNPGRVLHVITFVWNDELHELVLEITSSRPVIQLVEEPTTYLQHLVMLILFRNI